jgi:Cys-tRNA synthase (O-phospho-L-seryl-tRNA:Cys-tRNA synthase)
MNVALGIFAGVFLVVILASSRKVRNRVHRWRVAVVQWINAV